MVLAPEHSRVAQITSEQQREAVEAYVEAARHATEIERQSTEREKTGVFTGAYCVNRISGERVQIWIADYALLTYGTGAVMGVPGHDERDFEFAQQFGLDITVVVAPPGWDGEPLAQAYTGEGTMVNSGQFDGLPSEQGKAAVASYAAERGWGGPKVQYRLRDWLISRQRYWGAPIPMVYCDECGLVPVPEDQLPVELPYDVEFLPTGASPLALSEQFVQTTCPHCGRAARRETDTMDTFMCSAWYFMRYADPHNAEQALSAEAAEAWLPVDQYTGGAEHAVMHLLSSRFFYKAARDGGVVPGDEPFTRYFAQGDILGPDGRRMSKSRGNVVAPDGQVERWGADTFRAYLMFLGPWSQGGPYDVEGIVGVSRWLHRVWALVTQPRETIDAAGGGDGARELRRLTHRTLQRVTNDLDRFRLNTMVAALMELSNGMQRARDAGPVDSAAWSEAVEMLLLMLAPSCPHIAEELWARSGRAYSVHQQAWPEADPELARSETVEVAVQVDGRLRERIHVPADADEALVRAEAEAQPAVARHLEGRDGGARGLRARPADQHRARVAMRGGALVSAAFACALLTGCGEGESQAAQPAADASIESIRDRGRAQPGRAALRRRRRRSRRDPAAHVPRRPALLVRRGARATDARRLRAHARLPGLPRLGGTEGRGADRPRRAGGGAVRARARVRSHPPRRRVDGGHRRHHRRGRGRAAGRRALGAAPASAGWTPARRARVASRCC